MKMTMQCKSPHTVYAIKSKKSTKYALCMNLLPKRPKYANMHGKSIIIWSREVMKRIFAKLEKCNHLHGNPGFNH